MLGMPITVVISTWCVPFDQVVREIKVFSEEYSEVAILSYINAESRKWWDENDGDRFIREVTNTDETRGQGPYEPITELGYNHARYELWGGEQGFHAMLDSVSYARLHEEHYKRECDDKGRTRPGYLINAYVADRKPGGVSEEEKAKYEREQRIGFAALEMHYGKKLPE